MGIIKKFKDYFSKDKDKDKVLDVYSVYNLTYDEIEYTLLSFLEELDDYVIKPSATNIDADGHVYLGANTDSVSCLHIECVVEKDRWMELKPILEKAIRRFNGEYKKVGIVTEYRGERINGDNLITHILIYNPKEYTNESLYKRNMRDKNAFNYSETPFAKSYKKKEQGRPWFTREN